MDVLRLWHSRCSLFLYFRFILFMLKERCETDIGGNWLELSNIASGGAGALFWIRESGRYEGVAPSSALRRYRRGDCPRQMQPHRVYPLGLRRSCRRAETVSVVQT